MGRTTWSIALVLGSGCTIDRADPVVATRPASTLFVTDRGANAILRYDGVSGDFEDVFAAGPVQRIDRPAGVQLGPSGHVYLAGFGRGDVVRYDVSSGSMHDIFYWDTTLLEEPMDLVFHGAELLVLGNDTRNVVVVDADGRAVREFGFPTMRAAQDLALSRDETTLYVGTESHPELGAAIQVWDVAEGRMSAQFGSYDELATATSVALRDDGTLYACDWERGQLLRYDPGTGGLIEVVVDAASGRLAAPTEVEFGPDGALYVLDAVGIHRLDPDTGAERSLLIEVGDGHAVQPRSFAFFTEHQITAAIAHSR